MSPFAKLHGCDYTRFCMGQFIKEFLLLFRKEMKWWLVPLVIFILAIGLLILFSSGSALAPFMYPQK